MSSYFVNPLLFKFGSSVCMVILLGLASSMRSPAALQTQALTLGLSIGFMNLRTEAWAKSVGVEVKPAFPTVVSKMPN